MLYTGLSMRYLVAAALLFGLPSVLLAAERPEKQEKQYRDAVIVKVEQKTNTRVLYYVVNTPITKDEVYYEVSLQLADTMYVAKYTPRHANDNLPDEWSAESTVQARVHGRHLFIKRDGGTDVDLVIIRSKAVEPAKTTPQPAPGNK